jgi:tetratricopeptide (TPR) repeat protein
MERDTNMIRIVLPRGINRAMIILLAAVLTTAGCAGTIARKPKATKELAASKKQAMDLFIKGKVAETNEQHIEAVTHFLEAHQFDPGSAEIMQALSMACFRAQIFRTSLHYTRILVKMDPDEAKNWRLLQYLEEHEGNVDEATSALETYMDLSDTIDFTDFIRLALYYFELDRGDDARDMLMALASRNDLTADDMVTAADIMNEHGYQEESRAVLGRLVERDPVNVAAWIALGQLHEQQSRWQDAIDTYNSGLERNPGEVLLMISLGNLCLNINDWDCAIVYFERAARGGMEDPKVRKTLAALYFYTGRDRDAEKTIAALKEQGEDNSALYFSLGKAMNFLDRYQEAADYYRQGFEKGDISMEEGFLVSAYRGYARALVRLDRHADAVDLIRDGAGSHVEDRERLKVLEASIYMDMKRYDDALAIYEWLLASDPENMGYLLMIGQAYSTAGRYSEAEEVLKKAGTLEPEGTAHLVQLALLYDLNGRYDDAEEALEKVIEAEPENALAMNNLAYMYIEHGRRIGRAIDMVTRALEIEPNNGAYLDTLGWGYFQQGKLDRALDSIEQALRWEHDQDAAVIYDHYGDILTALGRTDDAAAAYRRALDLGGDSQSLQPKLDSL